MQRDHMRDGQRDADPGTHVRFARLLRADVDDDKGTVEVIASTDDAVDMGGYREILMHSPESVDVSSAKTVLFNHDRDQPIGGIQSTEITGGQLRATLDISREARARTGVPILELIRSGAIEGISIGYRYSDEDVEIDRETRTVTVRKWMLREISITPTQADVTAKITARARALADHFRTEPGNDPKEDTMGFDAWLKARGLDPEKLTKEQRDALKKDFDAEQERAAKEAKKRDDEDSAGSGARTQPKDGPDESGRAADIAKERERAERAERALHLTNLARSFGIDVGDENLGRFDSLEAGTKWLTKKKAEQDEERGGTHVGGAPLARVSHDVVDKQRDAAIEAFAGRVSGDRKAIAQGNPYARHTLRGMSTLFARSLGIDTSQWNKSDEANFFLGRYNLIPGMRAANIINSSFNTFVTLEAVTKVVARGYESGATGLVYPSIAERNQVPDFKASKIGAMGTANLQETAENVAFPELDKSEGVFSSAAKMWGGTLSLTLQALVNDDTGQFERSLRMAGTIAQKTKEKRAIQKFLLGTSADTATSTWTNNTTSGCTLVYTTADTAVAARQNLYNASIGMMNKIGGDGEPLGTIPRYLLCGPTNATYVNGLLSAAGGQPVANSGQLQPLVTPYLELATLTGYSTTTYYLVADPSMVTGLLETVIDGYESVKVEQYDAGAVAAMNWKLWLPFEFDLFSIANSAGTTIIPAAQQATT